MAIDPTITSGLAQIAETLEALAGIIPSSALKRDTDVIARLKRINDSIQGGAIEAHTLTSHSDVSAASIAGTYLRNDGVNWSESTILFADLPILSLPDLSDVTITVPVDNEVLRHNGVGWVNEAISLGSLSNVNSSADDATTISRILVDSGLGIWIPQLAQLNSLFDVVMISPANHDVMQFDTASPPGKWVNKAELTTTAVNILATIDHRIDSETDNLVFQNPNSNGDVIFRVNDGGVTHDLVKIDSSAPNIIIEPTGGAVTLASNGIIEIKGSWGRAGPWGAMRFNPTMTAGIGIGFLIDPLNGGSSSITGIQIKPTVGAALASVVTGIEFTPGSPSSGSNATHTGINESMPRALLAAGTWTLVGAKFGASATALGATAIVNDTHISLTGGGLAIAGGTVTQYGIRMQGYGTNTGSTIYALHSNGGTFALAADNQKLNFGAGEDASIYYDGTDLFIDPEVVGTGLMQFNGPASWLAAGATGTPALGNLPTAAAGTFNGWLTVKDDTGTTVYIPSFV